MFGTNASLAYGPQIQMRLIITDRTKIIYSMYREGEVVHRACCERTTQPYSLGGGGRFIQATDQQMLQHVVREW